MDSIEQLIEGLTEAHGVPGYEIPVRAAVRKYLKPMGEHSVELITRLEKNQREDFPA